MCSEQVKEKHKSVTGVFQSSSTCRPGLRTVETFGFSRFIFTADSVIRFNNKHGATDQCVCVFVVCLLGTSETVPDVMPLYAIFDSFEDITPDRVNSFSEIFARTESTRRGIVKQQC